MVYRACLFVLLGFYALFSAHSTLAGDGSRLVNEPSTSPPGHPVVKRTRYSTHYLLADGTVRAECSIEPVNYRAANGHWYPIRVEAVAVQEGSGAHFECMENGLQSRFGVDSTGRPCVGANAAGLGEISMIPVALEWHGSGDNVIMSSHSRAAVPRIGENPGVIEYPGVFRGALDEYSIGMDRLKHTLVLHHDAVVNGPSTAGWVGGVYSISLPAGHELVTLNGAPVVDGLATSEGLVVLENGEPRYRLGRVVVEDGAGVTCDGRYLIARSTGAGLTIAMQCPAAYATDPSRVFPIRIDPTLSLQPDAAAGKDAMISGVFDNPTVRGGSFIWMAGMWFRWILPGVNGFTVPVRSLFEFDLTSIPARANVVSASLHLNQQPARSNRRLTCHLFTVPWAEGAQALGPIQFEEAPIDTARLTGEGGTIVFSNFGPTAQRWIDGTVENNGIMMMSAELEDTERETASGSSSDGTVPEDRPRFIVDYRLPVMINAPAAGALPGARFYEAIEPIVFTAIDGVPAYSWSVSAGTLPPGLMLDAATGALSGTPTRPGSFPFTVTVRDRANQTDSRDYEIEVSSEFPVIFDPPAGALPRATQDAPVRYANPTLVLQAAGGQAPLRFSAVGLPPGLGIDSATGEIAGTATGVGTWSVSATVTDSVGKQGSVAYTLTVNPPVSISTTALSDAKTNELCVAPLAVNGGTGPYRWSGVVDPATRSVSIEPSTGTLSVWAPLEEAGTYTIRIQCTDRYGSVGYATLSLTIHPGSPDSYGCGAAASTRSSLSLQALPLTLVLIVLCALRFGQTGHDGGAKGRASQGAALPKSENLTRGTAVRELRE